MTQNKKSEIEISPELSKAMERYANRDMPAENWEFIEPIIRKDVGQLIREAREAKKMSQKGLSEKLGTRQAFISDLENGKTEPNVTLLIQLSYYLEQPVLYFIPQTYREFFAPDPVLREELSPEEEEIIRQMRAVYPVLSRGLILHLLRSLIEYDGKLMDFIENRE